MQATVMLDSARLAVMGESVETWGLGNDDDDDDEADWPNNIRSRRHASCCPWRV